MNPNVSSCRRKARKAHFNASSNERRKIMSSRLSKELRQKHSVKAVPIHIDDEVEVICGTYKGKVGKVKSVYRKKYVIHIDKITRVKKNNQTVNIGIHPSNVVIKTLKMDKGREALLQRKANGGKQGEGKAAEKDVEMSQVD